MAALPARTATVSPVSLLDPNHPDPEHQGQLEAWLQLHSALAFEPERALGHLARDEDPRVALARSGCAPPLGRRALDGVRQVMVRHGVRALPLTSPDYPEPLLALPDPSPLLFVRGEAAVLSGCLVAIVGARAATVYGLDLARRLGRRLAQAGVTVVSGLARGVDGAAHRGALDAHGQTIAVQACGPERVYPAEHRELATQIARAGAVVSELPVGTPPRAPYFPLRNRLISGLCRCVVVVEARERSGSLITARHALDQGREVMAFPGPITAPTSTGPNRLIRDGAVPILEVDDVLDAIGLDAPAASERREAEALGPASREILAVLARGALTRDELGRRFEVAPEQLDLDLIDLQLRGRVERDRDGRMVRVGGPPLGTGKRSS